MIKVTKSSFIAAGTASLILTASTLSTGALASASDRSDPAFPGDVTGLAESVDLGNIVSDMTPFTVGALNIDTGHVGQRDTGEATERGTRSRRSASRSRV